MGIYGRSFLGPIGGMLAAFMIFSPFGIKNSPVTGKDNKEKAEDKTVIEERINETTREYLPGIVCFGDSLTVGACGDGVTYPDVLKEKINEKSEYIDVDVVNCGVGGESSATVAMRSGAYNLYAHAFTIPADTTPVPIRFYSDVKQITYPVIQGNGGFNPVTIGGIEGKITANYDGVLARTTYTFTRSVAGDKTEIEKGELIIPALKDKYADYLNIIFIGTNGGFRKADELISQIDAILNRSGEMCEKYIVIGLFTLSFTSKMEASDEKLGEINSALRDHYTDHFIDLRAYLLTEALEDAGIISTEDDKKRLDEKLVPSSLMADDLLHLNGTGYTLLGELVYKTMDSLGYFTEMDTVLGGK